MKPYEIAHMRTHKQMCMVRAYLCVSEDMLEILVVIDGH